MTEEAPPELRRGVAHLPPHRDPPPHLVGAAVPRRRRSSASPALASLFYEEVFDLDERARGFVAAAVEPAQLLGLIVGARIGTKLVARDPGLILRFLGVLSFIAAGLLAGFALSPWLWLSVVFNAVVTARVRRHRARASSPRWPWRSRRGPGRSGFSIASLWVLPGLLILPIVGGLGDRCGLRHGHAADAAGVRRRRAHHLQRRQRDRPRHHAGVDDGRGPVRGGLRAPAGPVEAAPRPRPRRQLRRRAGALRREPRGGRGRDHRPARHQRRRQVHAAAGRSRGSSRPTAAPSSSTAST